MQDAQLISQAGLVESLASDGLVSVSTGAGQPQKNMELAKFADSLGSSVPLQQTSEQVSITGLYARTSDGKMVELTSDSVAKVMAKIAGKEDVSVDIQIGKDNCRYEHDVDANELFSSTFVVSCTNLPEGFVMGFIKVVRTEATKGLIQLFFEMGDSSALYSRYYNGSSWGSWRRIDNFGYNTLAELSSGVAEQIRYNAKLVNSVGINGGESLEVQIPTLYGCILFSISYADETSLFTVRAWDAIIDVIPIINYLKSFEMVANSRSVTIRNKTSKRIGISYGWHNLTNI